jgi:SAM-dependent methyltransferase
MLSAMGTVDAYNRLAPVWAATTDDNLWNELLERRMVRSLLPRDVAGSRVLDAGCAAGTHAAWFADQGCQVTGIDISPAMIDVAKRRLGESIRFEVADLGERLPFDDDAFDGIVSSLALHYLEHIAGPIGEFARVLRPDGWLIVTLDHPAAVYPGRPPRSYFETELITETWCKAGISVEQSFWRHPLEEVVNAFADNGFLIERIAEAKVDAEARRRFPLESASVDGYPSFIAFKAVPDPRRWPGGRPPA